MSFHRFLRISSIPRIGGLLFRSSGFGVKINLTCGENVFHEQNSRLLSHGRAAHAPLRKRGTEQLQRVVRTEEFVDELGLRVDLEVAVNVFDVSIDGIWRD